MIRDRGWGVEGNAAQRADAAALVQRVPTYVSYEEREQRNYWRLVASNREPQGRNTPRRGYLAPGTNVPGATPSDVVKGGKAKGGKSYGKRSRAEFEGGTVSQSASTSSSSWWGPDRSWNWGGSSGTSGATTGQSTWWTPYGRWNTPTWRYQWGDHR